MEGPRWTVRRGDGAAERPPLLFVHGAWHGAWCWEEHFLDWFAARGHDAYALDLPGHGRRRGEGSLRRLGIGDYVDAVAEALGDLPASTVLVGHSMGGYVVQRLLARRRGGPAVLLASVPPTGVAGITMRFAARHPGALLRATAAYRLGPAIDDFERARRLLFDPDLPEDEARRHFARLQDESYTAYLGMFRPVRTRRVRSPVLVVAGGADALVSRGAAHRTAHAYGTEPVVVPGAGHDLMLSLRWEEVAAEIAAFVGDEARRRR
ncbi:MAG TPA: alpha/beta fold hydrolase [Actinobacteria bacterium]|nr:alpha/beta fold hydrolase [Actinomycetota bacterium]